MNKNTKAGFSATSIATTVEVPVPEKAFTCAICEKQLGADSAYVYASPKLKGVVMFACKDHLSAVANALLRLSGSNLTVPDGLELPDDTNN